jgi:hypothetical protein
MWLEAHTTAAQEHEKTAKSHRSAAEHCSKGAHEACQQHAGTALDQSAKAHAASKLAHEKAVVQDFRCVLIRTLNGRTWKGAPSLHSRIRLRRIVDSKRALGGDPSSRCRLPFENALEGHSDQGAPSMGPTM